MKKNKIFNAKKKTMNIGSASVCPMCKSTELKQLHKPPCKCPYVDVMCKNGHVSHGFPGRELKPGPAHPSGPFSWKEFGIIGVFIMWCFVMKVMF